MIAKKDQELKVGLKNSLCCQNNIFKEFFKIKILRCIARKFLEILLVKFVYVDSRYIIKFLKTFILGNKRNKISAFKYNRF